MDKEGNPPKQLMCADDRERLCQAIDGFYNSAKSDQDRILRRAQRSSRVGAALVVISSVAVAVAGVTAIPRTGAWRWIAVGAAFIAALISLFNQSFNFVRGAQVKYEVNNQLWEIRSELDRLKRKIQLGHTTYDAAEDCLKDLEQQRREIGDKEIISGSLHRSH